MSRSTSWWRLLAIVAIGLVCQMAASTALSQERGSVSSSSTTSSSSSQSATMIENSGRPFLGDRAPLFKLKTFTGDEFELKALRNHQNVILIFLDERQGALTTYDGLEDDLRDRNVQLVFICHRGKSLEKKLYEGAPMLRDRWGLVAKSYGARDYLTGNTHPVIVMLDEEGFIRFYAAGYLPSADDLEVTAATVLHLEPEEFDGS